MMCSEILDHFCSISCFPPFYDCFFLIALPPRGKGSASWQPWCLAFSKNILEPSADCHHHSVDCFFNYLVNVSVSLENGEITNYLLIELLFFLFNEFSDAKCINFCLLAELDIKLKCIKEDSKKVAFQFLRHNFEQVFYHFLPGRISSQNSFQRVRTKKNEWKSFYINLKV